MLARLGALRDSDLKLDSRATARRFALCAPPDIPGVVRCVFVRGGVGSSNCVSLVFDGERREGVNALSRF